MVPVANVAGRVVVVDDLAHVLADLFCGGDRCASPRLEAVTECIEIAVRANARILVRQPRAAKALQALEHHEAEVWALIGKVVRPTDT